MVHLRRPLPAGGRGPWSVSCCVNLRYPRRTPCSVKTLEGSRRRVVGGYSSIEFDAAPCVPDLRLLQSRSTWQFGVDGPRAGSEAVVTEAEADRVVVGIGRSLGAYQALRFALREARRRDATLLAVRTFRLPTSEQSIFNVELLMKSAAENVRLAFAEAVGAMPDEPPIDVAVLAGPPASALVSVANRESDLLIIGGCGARRLSHMRSTAVARFCARHATCPVVIVPPTALARSGQPDRLARHTADDVEAYLCRLDRLNPSP